MRKLAVRIFRLRMAGASVLGRNEVALERAGVEQSRFVIERQHSRFGELLYQVGSPADLLRGEALGNQVSLVLVPCRRGFPLEWPEHASRSLLGARAARAPV